MNISIIVLTYNHEEYICECLESIKYQVLNFGSKNNSVEVVVTDDCSSDNTVEKVKLWESENHNLFNNFLIICNDHNIGTCKNYENALLKTKGEYIKLIGGDDLFPQKSMFDIFELLNDYDIVTGLPFEYVINGENSSDSIKLLTHKFQCINKELVNKSFYKLIERRCFLNAPATYIRREIATNPEVTNFVRNYNFTEDYPQWVKVSEIKTIKYIILDDYTIIYRRTNKSAEIVKGADPRFLDDRLKIYSYLYRRTKNIFTKLVLSCSISAFKKGKLMPNKYLNILSYQNKYYWIKNRNKVKPKSIDEIQSMLNYIKDIISI